MTEFAGLLEVSESQRSLDWEKDFLDQFATQKVIMESEETRLGPDHWPYLFVRSGQEATEPVWRILDWLSHRGVGLVVNAQKTVPDYVFTYGMIWNFKETGFFHSDPLGQDVDPDSLDLPDSKEAPKKASEKECIVVFQPGQQIISGPPNVKYIPLYVREVLQQFFVDQGIKKGPRWLMVSGDGKHYDLCFSVESLGNPPQKEHLGIAESLSWFFPSHFSIVLVSEKHFPKFYDLGDEATL